MATKKKKNYYKLFIKYLKITRPLSIPIAIALFAALLTIRFEQFPPSQKSAKQNISKKILILLSQTIASTIQNISPIFRIKVNQLYKRIPPWIPLWSIQLPYGSIDPRMPTIRELNTDAFRLINKIEVLKEHQFFRIFKTDLSKECPFWAREEMCSKPGACHICECADDQIPQHWRKKPVENFVDRNHYEKEDIHPWGPDNPIESAQSPYLYNVLSGTNSIIQATNPTVSDEQSTTASYVDLTLNRQSYTGYKGATIWSLIYKENCMGRENNPLEYGPEVSESRYCTEEDAFHKIISGIQSVIILLSSEYHHLKKHPLDYLKNMEEYKKRGKIFTTDAFRANYSPDLLYFYHHIALHRDWIENLYFTFGVLLRTICHISPILETCSCNTGTPDDDNIAKQQLQLLLKEPFSACREEFLDQPLFQRKQILAMTQFLNISRVMDCVECEKCRLHGKVKILALQLALRASGKYARLRYVERNEIIALINTLACFADGIIILNKFQRRLFMLKCVWGGGLIGAIALCLLFCRSKRKKTGSRSMKYIEEYNTKQFEGDNKNSSPPYNLKNNNTIQRKISKSSSIKLN